MHRATAREWSLRRLLGSARRISGGAKDLTDVDRGRDALAQLRPDSDFYEVKWKSWR